MAYREYIGSRYVPTFGRKGESSIEWDNTAPYEPLTVVMYQGNSYTSRQYVPIGIPISNTDYWASTGNYNAQVEAYRQEVLAFDGRITANAQAIQQETEDREEAINGVAGDIEKALAFDGRITANAQAIQQETEDREEAINGVAGDIETVTKDISTISGDLETVTEDISTISGDLETVTEDISTISGDLEKQKRYSGILSKCGRDFEIVDRWIIDRDGTNGNAYFTDQITSLQNGICFVQNGTRYYAQFVLTTATGMNDLYIRNIDSHTDIAVLSNVTDYHDPSMTYLDGYIYTVDDTTKTLIKINVTNPANPSITRIQLQHTTHYDLTAFISETEYVGLSSKGSTLDFYEVGSASMVKQLTLSSPTLMTTSVIQSMYANEEYCVFAHWQPNAVSIFDIVTGEHIKTFGMETWYDFVPCQEVESATIADNGLYVNLSQTLEGYNIPCVLYVPLDNTQTFKPSTNPFVFESNDTGLYRRQAYVNNTTGKLFMDTNHYPDRFEFKFATDAANALRSIGSGGTINIGGASYPRFIAIFDGVFRIAHYGSINTALAGMRFVNCMISITDLTSFSFYANNRYNNSEYNAIYCLACTMRADSTDVADWRNITVNAGNAPSSAKKRLLHLRQCISALQSPKNCRIEYGMVGLRYNADVDTNCSINYSCMVVSSEPETFER